MPAALCGGLYVGAKQVAERNLASGRPVPSDEAGPEPAAALLSLRRVPDTLAELGTAAAFDAAFRSVQLGLNDESCFVVSSGGRRLVDAGGDRSVVPASNTKLLTAVAALELLGPDATYVTDAVGSLSGDTVQGDLSLVGGGDPVLSTDGFTQTQKYQDPPQVYTSLDDLADRIVAAGVRTVTGDIVGDESRYDTRRFIPEWQEGIARVEGGPLSALLVNDGYDGDDWAEARATGNLPGDDPAAAAAAHLQRLLEARGVEIAGDAVSGVAPAGATSIARIESAPMAQIVTEMLTTSDNNTADLVVKEIGRVRMGEGSTTAGLRAERELFATWGLPVDQIEIFDGSGLSARNRVTCGFLIDLLDREADDPAFLAKLATAATSGTLRDAFVGTPAAGNLHAKTGTLSIARALSGYLIDDGEEVSFSLVVNGPGASALAQPLWDELGQAADDVPSPISPQQLEP